MVSLFERGAFFIVVSSNEYQIIVIYTFVWIMQIKIAKKRKLQSRVGKNKIICIFSLKNLHMSKNCSNFAVEIKNI